MFSAFSHLWPLSVRRIVGVSCRAWWALLILIHIAPLAATSRALIEQGVSFSAAVTCMALWLAVAFFVLKLLDVGFLRWRRRGPAVLVFTLIAALVHSEAAVATAGKAAMAELPSAVAASVIVESLKRAARNLPTSLRRLRACLHAAVAPVTRLIDHLVWLADEIARLHTSRLSIARAPPR